VVGGAGGGVVVLVVVETGAAVVGVVSGTSEVDVVELWTGGPTSALGELQPAHKKTPIAATVNGIVFRSIAFGVFGIVTFFLDPGTSRTIVAPVLETVSRKPNVNW
jgi:hypothetical protein